MGSLCAYHLKVGRHTLGGGVGELSGQNVLLEEEVVAVQSLQHHVASGQLASGLHVGIGLVVHTALQLGTHSGELRWVEREVLKACGIGAYRREVLHPSGAAQFSSARSGASNAPGFLARTNLLHLYPYVEGCCQVLDELAKVHSLVGDIVEDGLVAVALILHVAYLHLQSQPLGYLPALNHRVVFARLGLMIFLHVHLSGVAIDAPNVVGRFQVGLLHLQLYEPAG